MSFWKTVKNLGRKAAKEADKALKDPALDMEFAIEDSKKKVEEFRGQVSKLNAHKNVQTKHLHAKESKQASLEVLLLKADEAGNEDDVATIVAQIEVLETDIEQLKQQISTTEKDVDAARGHIRRIQQSIDDAENNKERLEVRKESAEMRQDLAKSAAGIASENPLASLGNLEKEVEEQEALAESLEEEGSLTDASKVETLEEKYAEKTSASDRIAKLKAKQK
jgi:phage shock protein A